MARYADSAQKRELDDIIIVDPVTMRPWQTISEALQVMEKYKISGVPVVDDTGKLRGILTNRDLRFETRPDRPISSRMTHKNLITTPVGTTLEEAKGLLQSVQMIVRANDYKINDTVENLREATDNLNQFTNSLKQRPWSLVRVKQPEERQVPK